MRLGVLSDLHANLPALEAALEALRAEGVDEVLVLGDLVGYGPHPRQVIHRIWEEGLAAIAGAWDLRVAYPLPGPLPEGVGKATLEWTRAQLGEKELAYLRSLRLSHRKSYGGCASWPSTGSRGTPRGGWTFWAPRGTSLSFWSGTGPRPCSSGEATFPWRGGWGGGLSPTRGAWA